MLSARNQFPGTVKSVTLGNVMAEVVVTVGGIDIVSAITRGSAEALGLKVGDTVKAIIKDAQCDRQGRFIDPNTNQPIEGTPDIGHIRNREFWKERN